MVQYYTSNVITPSYTIYMGDDKFENEDLIKWSWPEDVWFHVDKLSSAHVYLRLHEGESIEDIPKQVLEDCTQLVKANSIQGNKQNNLDVVYTLSSNLKKTADMEVGQVGFHKQKEVYKYHVEKRLNDIVNRLNKTRVDKKIDLRAEKEERDANEARLRKEKYLAEKKREKEEKDLKKIENELKSYSSLMKSENMTSNLDAEYDSDDFM